MHNDFDERMRKMRESRKTLSVFIRAWIMICLVLTIGGLFSTAYVLSHPELIGEYFCRISAGAQTPCAKTTLPIGDRLGHIRPRDSSVQ
jgi:hypothetical protein